MRNSTVRQHAKLRRSRIGVHGLLREKPLAVQPCVTPLLPLLPSRLSDNIFTDVGTFEFPESTEIFWKGNELDDGCIEEDDVAELNLAEGSDGIPVC